MDTATQDTAVSDAKEQEERQDAIGFNTDTLMGVLSGKFLIGIAIIRVGDAAILIRF